MTNKPTKTTRQELCIEMADVILGSDNLTIKTSSRHERVTLETLEENCLFKCFCAAMSDEDWELLHAD